LYAPQLKCPDREIRLNVRQAVERISRSEGH
jgi:hypothetical protein